jgi:hypothetical protein
MRIECSSIHVPKFLAEPAENAKHVLVIVRPLLYERVISGEQWTLFDLKKYKEIVSPDGHFSREAYERLEKEGKGDQKIDAQDFLRQVVDSAEIYHTPDDNEYLKHDPQLVPLAVK